jgi:tetratricopeptide (TPR) repeat protein
MEVAMFASLLPRLQSLLLVVFIASCLPGLTGCADMVTYARTTHEKGMELYRERLYADAAGTFRSAIRQDPRYYPSHFYLGVCHEQMGQYQQAFQEYRATIEIMSITLAGRYDPEFRQMALDALASAIARHDDNEVELNRTERDAREKPTAENWFLLAKVHRLRGDADSAISAYRRAINFDSTDFNIRKEFGLYLLEPLGQRQEAEQYLRQAYRLNPNDQAVNDALARMGVVPLPAQATRTRITPAPQAGINPAE